MMFSTVLDYVCGGIIGAPGAASADAKDRADRGHRRRPGAARVFQVLHVHRGEPEPAAERIRRRLAALLMQVVLPIGISFYTFESMSYTIDVYRGEVAAGAAILRYLLLCQPVSAPGRRARSCATTFSPSRSAIATHTLEKFTARRRDVHARLRQEDSAGESDGLGGGRGVRRAAPLPLDAWVGVIAYAFQIYFDFSGYSDMAIGLGRMFGFVIPENFRSPYLSESITDFWRRWHISLSTWLRDYLYIPLGGNRKGPRRTYINLALVMLLGGLWHGADWTFVVWGAYHGTLLAFERWMGKKSPYDCLPRAGRIAVTLRPGALLVGAVPLALDRATR